MELTETVTQDLFSIDMILYRRMVGKLRLSERARNLHSDERRRRGRRRRRRRRRRRTKTSL